MYFVFRFFIKTFIFNICSFNANWKLTQRSKILLSNKLRAYIVMQIRIVVIIIGTYYMINLSVWRLCPAQKAFFHLIEKSASL